MKCIMFRISQESHAKRSTHKLFSLTPLFLVALIPLNLVSLIAQAAPPNTKLDTHQEFFTHTNITDETSAHNFLISHAQRYQLTAPETLKFSEQQPSLYSRHYRFQQTYNDLPVDRAEIIVSVDAKTNTVIRVYNNTQILLATPSNGAVKPPVIGTQVALQNIWQHQLTGSVLRSKPRARLVYAETSGQLRLVYRINLITNRQPGNWEYTVDAHSGELLSIERLDTPAFMPDDFQRQLNPAELKKNHNPQSYQSALTALNNKNQLRKKIAAENSTATNEVRTNGTALLFDPDPITALQKLELSINSPLEDFTAAYVERPLRDITLTEGVYQLRGPWVTIEDNESPETTPSTTTDGNWRAKRNESAFQDAMAYFHLDQSQRYIQSLGFTQTTGIQYASISVDAQGAFGVHNAFYNSFDNAISFGVATGCPAMAEDADVILHEYGHAIHFSINPGWYGGDTGAMGEGFADYWSASYNLTTTNGATFYPERMGNWIAFNSCWPDGRLLTRTDTRHLKGKTYQAHEKVGDHYSDELWSAPLYNSLRELMKKGIAREEVDRLILEAHFGLGSDVTMEEMAKAIVLSAQQLHPQGPHAEVFRRSFIAQDILPGSLTLDNPQLFGTQGNDIIQPGTSLGTQMLVRNNSALKITDIKTEISSTTPGVTVDNNEPATLVVDAESSTTINPRITLAANAPCGSALELQAKLNYTDPYTLQQKTSTHSFNYLIGQPVVTRTETKPNLKIPATSSEIITSELAIQGLQVNAKYFKLHLDIRIPLFSTPTIILQSPTGTRIALTNLPFWESRIDGSAPDDFGFNEMFVPLNGENPNGIWKLEIKQPSSNAAAGLLKSWGITTLTNADCTPGITEALAVKGLEFSRFFLPVALPGINTTSFSKGSNVNLDYVLQNNTLQPISNIGVALTSSAPIANLKQSPPVNELPAFSARSGKFQFDIPADAACGSNIPIKLRYSYLHNEKSVTREINHQLSVGTAFNAQFSTVGEVRNIPDNDANGLSETVHLQGQKAFDATNTRIRLVMEHPNPTDLSIQLRSPQGTTIDLVKPGTNLPNYLNDFFPQDLTTATPLAVLNGENPNGIWTITLKDGVAGNIGNFHWVGIEMRNELDCDRNNLNAYPSIKLNSDNFEVTEGQSLVIDASASTDPDGDTLSFNYAQVAGPTQLLGNNTSAIASFTAPEVSETTEFSYLLEAKDYYGFSDKRTIVIRVNNRPAVSSAMSHSSVPKQTSGSTSGGGGGSTSLLLILLLATGYGYRTSYRNRKTHH